MATGLACVRGIVEHVQSGDPAKLFMIYNVTGGVLGVLHSVPNLPGVLFLCLVFLVNRRTVS